MVYSPSAHMSNHWNYFLALDADVVRLSRYLEPTEHNFNAHSIELSRILLVAASEIDVVAKMMCVKIDENSKANNMDQYRKEILLNDSRIADTHVHVPRYRLSFKPWEEWAKGKNPQWWKAYNNVKHQRHIHFAEANLNNSLNAVAGLFVLLLFYYRNESQNGLLSPDPTLLRAGEPFKGGRNMYEPYSEIYLL